MAEEVAPHAAARGALGLVSTRTTTYPHSTNAAAPRAVRAMPTARSRSSAPTLAHPEPRALRGCRRRRARRPRRAQVELEAKRRPARDHLEGGDLGFMPRCLDTKRVCAQVEALRKRGRLPVEGESCAHRSGLDHDLVRETERASAEPAEIVCEVVRQRIVTLVERAVARSPSVSGSARPRRTVPRVRFVS